MHLTRFVQISVGLLALGFAACVLGCFGEQSGQGVTPPDKEASKKIAEEMKSAQLERMKAMGKVPKAKGAR
jgi:hypothetical protein